MNTSRICSSRTVISSHFARRILGCFRSLRPALVALVVIFAWSLIAHSSALGATRYWNANGAAANVGSGTWSTGTSAWSTTDSSTAATVVWTDGSDAVFHAGSVTEATTITISGTVKTGGTTDITIRAGATGTITGGTLTRMGGGTLTYNAGAVMNISTTIANDGGNVVNFSKTGGVVVNLNTAASYTGTTSMAGSQGVRITISNALPTGTALTVSSNFRMNGGLSQTVGSLTGAGDIQVDTAGTSTFTVNGSSSTTFTGRLLNSSGTLAFVKNGASTLILSNDTSTYTSTTTLTGGTLQFTSVANSGTNSSLGNNTSNIVVNGTGTTLKYAGTAGGGHSTSRIFAVTAGLAAFTLDASGTGAISYNGYMDFGSSGSRLTTLTLTGTGTGNSFSGGAEYLNDITKTSTGTWNLQGAPGAPGGGTAMTGAITVDSSGTLNLTAGTWSFTRFNIRGGSAGVTATMGVSGTASLTMSATSQVGGNEGAAANIGNGILNQSAGTITANQAFFVGRGTNNVGTYNLSGGTFVIGSGSADKSLYVGNANGSTLAVEGTLNVSSTGAVNGSASGSFLWVGVDFGSAVSRGFVNQTGGTVTIDNLIYLGHVASTNSGIGRYDISAGTLTQVASGGDIRIGGTGPASTGAMNVSSTATVSVGGTLTVAGVANATGTYTQTGSSATGVTVAGNFRIGNGASTSGTATISGGKLAIAGNLFFGTGTTRTFTVNNTSSPTVTIGGVDASTNNTTANSANMNGTGEVSLGTSTKTFNVFNSTPTIDLDVAVKLTSGGGSGLTKSNTGVMRLGNSANDYTGDTTISGGTIQINAGGGAIPNTSTVIFSASSTTLDLNNNNETVYALSSASGNGLVTSSAGGSRTLTASPTSGTTTFSGVIENGSGTTAFTKSGAGTQVLSGTNTYTGATTVSNGTLSVNGSLASGSSVTVQSGATLGGTGTINGAVTVQSGGRTAPGNSAGTETYAGGLDYSAGGIYDWELDVLTETQAGSPPPWNFDQIFITGGNLALGGSSSINLIFNAADPDSDPFWNTNRTWTVIDVSGSGTNTGSTNFASITNGTWTNGSFTTTVSGGDILLNWILAATGNNTQILIDTPTTSNPTTGASTKTISLGNVLLNSTSASDEQLNKTGSDTTTYTVTLGGSATSTFASGSFAGGTQSATGSVGIVTSTYNDTATGTVTINNDASDSAAAGQGSDDANDVFNVSANVGKATANTSNNPSLFGAALTATVDAGGTYTGLASKVFFSTGTGASGPVLGSEAKIMLGTNSSGVDTLVSMAWRARTQDETPTEEGGTPATPTPLPPLAQGLFSDVVRLTGMVNDGDPSGETDPFALQMDYAYTLMESGLEAKLAQNGLLFLAWLNPTGDSGINPQWQLSVLGNFGTGANAYDNYQGSWTTFAADSGKPGGIVNAGNLASFLGSWGVDITSHTVWAVLNHNSDFAVIPEPSTWALGLLGSVGVGLAAWRRRRK